MRTGSVARLHLLPVLSALLLAVAIPTARGDTNQALAELLAALTQNGTLTREQAETIRRVASEGNPSAVAPAAPTPVPAAPEPAKKSAPAMVFATPKEKAITRLVVSGKVQPQWDSLATRVSNGPELATRNTFSLRRLQLGIAGDIGADWTGLVEGDFAATNTLEQGYITYKGLAGTELTFGHTKVPFLREELMSDSVLKGVERSASHRAFVEQAGRGFGGKNTGLHLRSKWENGFNVAAAVTNPGAKNFTGAAGNVSNELAYYAHAGFNGPFANGHLEYGLQGAWLPDFLAAGPISALAAHVLYENDHLIVLGEAASARFARTGHSPRQIGLTLETTLKLTPRWDAVLRYSDVDSDGLGLAPGALIRNAPATGDFDQLDSIYVGGNYYFSGNAVRFTFGYEHAEATGRLTGPAEENTIDGFRSRFQFLF